MMFFTQYLQKFTTRRAEKPLSLVLFLLVLGVSMLAKAEKVDNLSDFRWKSRLILVNAQSNEQVQTLSAEFDAEAPSIEERHVLWFILFQDIVFSNHNNIDATALRSEIAAHFEEINAYQTVLIGKDGGEKLRQPALDIDKIFLRIDAMPMRVREISKQRGSVSQ